MAIGYGAGSTHQAATRLAPDQPAFSWLPDIYLEEENGRVAVELGWIGFVVFLALKTVALLLAYSVLRNSRSSIELVVGAAAVVFLGAHILGEIVFNSTAAAFYWTVVGAVVYVRSQQLRVPAATEERLPHSVPTTWQ